MNTDTYGGWLTAWGIAMVPLSVLGYFAFGPVGIIVGPKLSTLMMLAGRCFWKRHQRRRSASSA